MRFSDQVLQDAYDKGWFFEAALAPVQYAFNMQTFREWQRDDKFFSSMVELAGGTDEYGGMLGIGCFNSFLMSEELVHGSIAATTVLAYIKRKVADINSYTRLVQYLDSQVVRKAFIKKYLRKYAVTSPGLLHVNEFVKSAWNSIKENRGSVSHLSFIPKHIRKVFRTPKEINPCCNEYYPEHPYELPYWKEAT